MELSVQALNRNQDLWRKKKIEQENSQIQGGMQGYLKC